VDNQGFGARRLRKARQEFGYPCSIREQSPEDIVPQLNKVLKLPTEYADSAQKQQEAKADTTCLAPGLRSMA
jgi:hypothetical protein